MWPVPQETADLVTFTDEILNGKRHFLCSVCYMDEQKACSVSSTWSWNHKDLSALLDIWQVNWQKWRFFSCNNTYVDENLVHILKLNQGENVLKAGLSQVTAFKKADIIYK